MTTVPIAIVGVAAHFPGSSEPDGFWRNILAGRNLVGPVPPSHWLLEDYYDPNPAAPGKTYTDRGAFLSPLAFDPLAYGVTPANIPTVDTEQLLALVVARRAFEDACGPGLERLDRGRTSVILGVAGATEAVVSMAGFLQRPLWAKALREAGMAEADVTAICDRVGAMYAPWTENTFPGMLPNVVAGRIANRFDLGGTNCTTDAACASALAALRMAVDELALGSADLVLTGGVDALNDILMYVNFSKTPAMSASGVCRPFSEGADGTLMGEGIGMFALRRLADAERDGDPIYAVIRGVGTSSDGRAKSVYAPRAEGQALALGRAYAAAGYGPETVELVEAHGTGTVAGDAAEFGGLREVFGASGRADTAWCALGSVKSQIGHTKAAAGSASLYKTVMALHHKVYPPTINVTRPNPALAIEESPFYLNTSLRPWVRGDAHPRRASLSSFGFGGSNFHVTLEEYAGPNRPPRIRSLDSELFLLGAQTPQELIEALLPIATLADGTRDFIHAARATQAAFAAGAPARLALVARDAADLREQALHVVAMLTANPDVPFTTPRGATYALGTSAPGKLAYLFPGQGSQYPGMGLALATAFASASAAWDAAASDGHATYSALARRVFPPTPFDDATRSAQVDALRATDVAQPAIGIASLAAFRVLGTTGLRPDAVAGHSYGELTALHAAGALDEAAFRMLSRRRGEVMAQAASVTEGTMLAIFADAARVEAMLADCASDATIANYNAPEQTVAAGTTAAIARLAVACAEAGVSTRPLDVATAFHSAIVAPAVPAFAATVAASPFTAPHLPVIATTTAAAYPAEADAARGLLAGQLAQPVRFTEQIETLYAAGVRVFVEVGPGSTLTGLVGKILGDREHAAFALDRKNAGLAPFWTALGALAVAGFPVDTRALWDGYDAEPTAPVQHSRATVAIDGANLGKPYPPRPGTTDVPKPAAAAPAAASPALPAPTPTVAEAAPAAVPPLAAPSIAQRTPLPMSSSDDSVRQQTVADLIRNLSEAHVATQRLWAETHHDFMRTAAIALESLANAPQHIAPSAAPAPPAIASIAPSAALASGHIDEAVVAPIAPPVAATAPIAPPVAAAGSAPSAALLLEVVASKTGYPVEMIGLEMDLEADLGIDSIKRVEILSAFREAAPNLPELDPRELASLQTLGAILSRFGGLAETSAPQTSRAAVAAADVATPPPAAAPATASVPDDDMQTLLGVVAAKTGYPVEMIQLDMDLEADLGIDSIKRVEILSAFREAAPHVAEVDPRELASLQTLRAIHARFSAVPAASAPEPVLTRRGLAAVAEAVGG